MSVVTEGMDEIILQNNIAYGLILTVQMESYIKKITSFG